MPKVSNPTMNNTRGTINDMVYSERDGGTIISKYRKPKNPKTPAQTKARGQFGTSSATWKTLSIQGKASYSRQAATMKNKSGKPMTGKNLYVQIAATLTLLGQEVPEICPQKPDILPQMPSVVFLSSYSTGSSFVMLVHSDGLVTPVICEAIQSVTGGVELFNTRSFRVIAVASGLLSPTSSLATPYANKFGTPYSGTQIAVRLTPVSPSGYRGTPVIYSAFVASSQAEMEEDLERRRAELAAQSTLLELVAA